MDAQRLFQVARPQPTCSTTCTLCNRCEYQAGSNNTACVPAAGSCSALQPGPLGGALTVSFDGTCDAGVCAAVRVQMSSCPATAATHHSHSQAALLELPAPSTASVGRAPQWTVRWAPSATARSAPSAKTTDAASAARVIQPLAARPRPIGKHARYPR